jgi:type IV pilus assembly protein PilV
MSYSTISAQRGATLIEALVAALLFLIGVLGLIGVTGQVITNQSDVQFRSQAAKFASEMMNTIWLNVDRTTAASTVASLQGFSHLPTTGGPSNCTFSGTPSTSALVSTWVANITAGGALVQLPGADATMQQIWVDPDPTQNNHVTITLCWQASRDVAPHKYVLSSYVN